jgi:hypothetical protein
MRALSLSTLYRSVNLATDLVLTYPAESMTGSRYRASGMRTDGMATHLPFHPRATAIVIEEKRSSLNFRLSSVSIVDTLAKKAAGAFDDNGKCVAA